MPWLRIFTIAALIPLLGGWGPWDARKVKKANAMYAQGKWSQAQEQYAATQANQPSAPELYFNLGDVKYKLKEYPQAEEMFKKVLLGPPSAMQQKGFYNLGNVKVRLGQLEEALGMYKKAMELDPADKEAKFNYEWVLNKIKEMKKQSEQQQKQEKQDKQDNKDQKDKQNSQSQQGKKQDQKSQQEKEEQKKDKQNKDKKNQQQSKPDEIASATDALADRSPSARNDGKAQQDKQDKKDDSLPTGKSNTQETLAGKKELSKEEAKALLQWMDEEERRARAKQEAPKASQTGVEKDW